MTFYHFTCLFHLPSILKSGLTMGEVPIEASPTPNAVNLTTNQNPDAQFWKRGSAMDKTKVRLTVQIPHDDASLMSSNNFCKQRGVSKQWQRAIDPYGQSKFWYLYFGPIPPTRIEKVEIMENGEYVLKCGTELNDAIASIETESQKFVRDGDFVRMRDGFHTSWLLDGGT